VLLGRDETCYLVLHRVLRRVLRLVLHRVVRRDETCFVGSRRDILWCVETQGVVRLDARCGASTPLARCGLDVWTQGVYTPHHKVWCVYTPCKVCCVWTTCVQTHQTACALGQSTRARREHFWEFADVKRVLQSGCARHGVLDIKDGHGVTVDGTSGWRCSVSYQPLASRAVCLMRCSVSYQPLASRAVCLISR